MGWFIYQESKLLLNKCVLGMAVSALRCKPYGLLDASVPRQYSPGCFFFTEKSCMLATYCARQRGLIFSMGVSTNRLLGPATSIGALSSCENATTCRAEYAPWVQLGSSWLKDSTRIPVPWYDPRWRGSTWQRWWASWQWRCTC